MISGLNIIGAILLELLLASKPMFRSVSLGDCVQSCELLARIGRLGGFLDYLRWGEIRVHVLTPEARQVVDRCRFLCLSRVLSFPLFLPFPRPYISFLPFARFFPTVSFW